MAYKTKPELEEGNFIVYTNEPDTVVDSADIGGGGSGASDVFEEYPFRVVFAPFEGITISESDSKPELEEGNFIVYTNEPDTVVDSADIGGGGSGASDVFEEYPFRVVFAPFEGITISESDLPYFEEGLTVNGEYIAPKYDDEDGTIVYEFTAKALDLIDITGVGLRNNWSVDDFDTLPYGLIYATFGPLPVTDSVPFYYAPPKAVIDLYKSEEQTFDGAELIAIVTQTAN